MSAVSDAAAAARRGRRIAVLADRFGHAAAGEIAVSSRCSSSLRRA